MIDKISFKGLTGIKLENEDVSVVVLPELGGKIASFYHKQKDFEVVEQYKGTCYQLPEEGGAFEQYDCSGFDDAFPSIDQSSARIGNQQIDYPDHGEIWTASFLTDVDEAQQQIRMSYESKLLGYTYQKQFSIEENSLSIEYWIKNSSNTRFPYIWTFHDLAILEDGMQIILPQEVQWVENVLESKRLGFVGKKHSYPMTVTGIDLSRIYLDNKVHCEKFYIANPLKEGKAALFYPQSDIYYELEWDPEKLPYLGFWMTKGAFKGDYNCALEPASSYYDHIEIADKNETLRYLEVGEQLTFTLKLRLR